MKILGWGNHGCMVSAVCVDSYLGNVSIEQPIVSIHVMSDDLGENDNVSEIGANPATWPN
jgi:hypothetical protein